MTVLLNWGYLSMIIFFQTSSEAVATYLLYLISRGVSLFQENPSCFSSCKELYPRSASTTSYFLPLSWQWVFRVEKFWGRIVSLDWSPVWSEVEDRYWLIISGSISNEVLIKKSDTWGRWETSAGWHWSGHPGQSCSRPLGTASANPAE